MAVIDSLAVMDGLRPGDHLCQLYQTENERLAALTAFLRQGLERGEKVFYFASDRANDNFLNSFPDQEFDFQSYLDQGQLAVFDLNDSFLQNGFSDPDKLAAFLDAKIKQIPAGTYTGSRFAGELTRFAGDPPGPGRLLEYESKLSGFLSKSGCSAICQYDRKRFDPALLLEALSAHTLLIFGSELLENIYYSPAEARLGRRLNNLKKLNQRKKALSLITPGLQNIIEAIPDAIYVKDAQGRNLLVNKAFEEITGLSRREIQGKTDQYMFAPDLAADYRKNDEEVMTTGKPLRFEEQTKGKNGQTIFFETIKIPLFDKQGCLAGLMGVSRNITELKQSEEDFKKRLSYEEAIAYSSKILVESADIGQALQMITERLLSATGVSRVYIFENFEDPVDGTCMRQINEAVFEGVTPEIDNPLLQRLPYSEVTPIFLETMVSGEPYASLVSEMSIESRIVLEPQGILSIMMLPIIAGKNLWGFIGFDDCLIERVWREEDIQLLQTVASMIGNVIEHGRAEQALRESEQRFRTLVETIPHGIQEIDTSGKITFANSAYFKLLGRERDEVIGKPVWNMITPGSTPQGLRELIRFLLAVQPEPTPWIGKDHTKSGETVDVEINWNYRRDKQDRVTGFISVVTDITDAKRSDEALRRAHDELERRVEERTAELVVANERLVREIEERKRAEEALKMSEAKFRAITENTTDMTAIFDEKTIFRYVSPSIQKLAGYSIREIQGRTPAHFVHPDHLPMLARVYHRIKQKPGSTVNIPDIRIRHGDGTWLHLEVAITSMLDVPGVKGTVINCRDITERKRAEKGLLSYQKRLSRMGYELLLTEERERRRIATNLHDHIGQSLAMSKFKLKTLRQSLSSSGQVTLVDEICGFVEEMILQTRSLTFDLSPPILYELGLESAVEWLAEQIHERYNIQTEFNNDGQPKELDDDLRVFLFRAVRELLMNVVKHAQASKVKISMRTKDDELCIEVDDDGLGYDSSARGHSGLGDGFGLFSIRERIVPLGGHLWIKSMPDRGTRATLATPLKPRERNIKEIAD
ncbi:MAG: PAS domain S-box protein [Thermodesulfobacteriota bacterium]|nr:PAS domain S-box protein [Thermodesulfobacteriota bacterium]